MKSTGVIRRIDELGRIVIPKEIRKKNNIDKETVLEWSIDKEGNTIVNFRKRRDIRNLIGAFSTEEKTNAVELKRSLYE